MFCFHADEEHCETSVEEDSEKDVTEIEDGKPGEIMIIDPDTEVSLLFIYSNNVHSRLNYIPNVFILTGNRFDIVNRLKSIEKLGHDS